MRHFLIIAHRYTGLFLGLALSVTGVSGSLIVFDRELDEWLEPKIADFSPQVSVGDLDKALANAASAVDNGTKPTRIALGRDASAPHIVRFPTPVGSVGPIEVTINPNTSEVTSVRTWGEYPVTWIYRFHYSFLSGESGEIGVGVLGLALLFFCLSGVVIWWPRLGFRSKQQLKRAFSVRLNTDPLIWSFDLHRLIGIVFLLPLVVVAFTGIELVWHEPVEKLISLVLPVDHEPEPTSSEAVGEVSVNLIHAQALSEFPDARVSRIYLPRSDTGTYQATMIRRGDWWKEFGATQVWMDRHSAEVVDRWDSKNLKIGNTILEWMFPLHNGDGLGMAGRVLMCITGLLPAFFFISGFYIWLRKRRTQKIAAISG